MAEYDGLPLNTPTVIEDTAEFQRIATRTQNGGTVQVVPKPGSVGANTADIQAKLVTAKAANDAFLAVASPTNAQIATHVKVLTRELNGLIKLMRGDLADTTGT